VRKQRPHALLAGWLVSARLVLERYRWLVAVARARLRHLTRRGLAW
jgi:hypothetical protein